MPYPPVIAWTPAAERPVPSPAARRASGTRAALVVAAAVAIVLAACGPSAVPATAPIVPGDASAPREVNLIAKDYAFLPDALDLVPGETILLHVINGGLDTHEAVIGDPRVQDAWAAAEAAVAGAPPGPTPLVSVPPDIGGLRIVVRSGERVDVVWTVPADAGSVPPDTGAWIVGCHIPGHLAKGMQIPVRWVDANSAP